MEHRVIYNKDSNPHGVLKVKTEDIEFVAVDLFPYKILDRSRFYERDHPKQMHPDSPVFDQYWAEFEKKCIEGYWVEDKEGTWVFMPPKLYYYINYCSIVLGTGDRVSPWLRDIEWIIFSYWLCCEGFSGFENDDKYTSHYLAKKLKEEKIDEVEMDKIPPSCYNKKGEIKEYVEPWYFLTKTYLVDDPRGNLGRPLYSPSKEDKRKEGTGLLDMLNRLNGIILGCHSPDTKIRMSDGSTKRIKDIEKGEYVMGRDGTPRKVKDKVHGVDDMYEVKQANGLPYICSSKHKLVLSKKRYKAKWENKKLLSKTAYYEEKHIEVAEYYNDIQNKDYIATNYTTISSKGIEYPETEHFIDPYFMGLWVGDGFKGVKMICGGVSDTEHLDWLKNYADSNPNLSYKIFYANGGVGENTWRFRLYHEDLKYKGNWWAKNFVYKEKPKDKHIPEEYLIDSEANRLKLLAGIIDSDGTWDKNKKCHTISTSEVLLKDQYIFLAKSLGFEISVFTNVTKGLGKNLRRRYSINLYGKNKSIPNIISRKKATVDRVIRKGKGSNRSKLEVTPIGKGEYIGIEVDKDNLYLLEDYTVTHNCRGIGKSLSAFQGIIFHEFTFGGVKFMEDIENTSRQLLFGLGCATKDQLQRSINSIKTFHDNQPGKFRFEDSKEADYMGPFYKNVQGAWQVGKNIEHIIKGGAGGNQAVLNGSVIQMGVIEPGRTTIGAGGRSRIIAVEEFGFMGELAIEVYNATRDSLKVNKQKVGHLLLLGTAGDMKKILGPKKMFEDPESFETFGIPNYWTEAKKKIGLFISVLYQYRDYEDGEGNINIEAALDRYMADRKHWAETMDGTAYTSQLMYNPLVPRDMLIPNSRSLLPKREAQNQLADIEENDLYQKFANSGILEWSKASKYGVKFIKDMDGTHRVIQDYSDLDFDKIDKSGRFVQFEPPKETIPPYTYFVCFDPTKPKDDDGTSLNGVIVYKHFNTNGGWLSDGIAAVWCGRMESLEENYEQVIKIAKYFNATIFVETNVGGFISWCRDRGYFDMLQSDSYRLESELGKGQWKRNYHKVGCEMTTRKKEYALKALRDWLNTVRNRDEVTGAPTKKNINYIFSKRILNEIINHQPGGNYDLLSALLLLMILFSQLDDLSPEDEYQDYTQGYEVERLQLEAQRAPTDYRRRQPSFFERM